MARPLYRTGDDRKPQPRGHAGLWFDKFCDTWPPAWKMRAPDKLKWIEQTTGQVVGNRAQIRESTSRMMRLARMLGGRAEVYEAESRFVTGLGRSHPVENGFAWHPTLGTPFLPGSSVKGMVGAWAKAEQEVKRDRILSILGSQGQVGRVRFLDAVPTDPVSLEADVMTPHYAGWNPQQPPGDWCSPTPIPFLTTAPGTRFVFGVVPILSTQADDLDVVVDWLDQALRWAGAGAKTAVGYGRMQRDDERERQVTREIKERDEQAHEERERRAKRAAMTPIEREIADELGNPMYKGMPRTTAIDQMIQAGRWQDDYKKAAVKLLQEDMKAARRWKTESHKKRPDRDKDHQMTLRVLAWMKE